MAEIRDLPNNLYYVQIANNEGEVISEEFEIAETPELCIAVVLAHPWRESQTHVHSIEPMCEFRDYKRCLGRLETHINYTFAQVEQLSIMAGQYADMIINGEPENAELDQGHAGTLSYAADLVEDRLEEVKKYIRAIEYLTTKQRCSNREIRAQQKVAQ